MGLVQKFGGEDAIGPETPEPLTQLAPGREQPHRLGIADVTGQMVRSLSCASRFR